MSFCKDPVRARMRTTLSYVLIAAALTSAALLITNSRFKLISHSKRSANTPVAAIDKARTTRARPTTARPTTARPTTARPTTAWTTPGSGIDLRGKMFTMSDREGKIHFYSPSFTTPDPWAPRKTSTQPYSTRNRPYTTSQPYTSPCYPWTTAPPLKAGVSVCLRYLSTYQANIESLFTLSPIRDPLRLGFEFPNTYYFQKPYLYSELKLKPYINFWLNIPPEIWTRVCLTVDSVKNVAQVFSGSNMSIRKVLQYGYEWSGEPVIEFSGFAGQLTDVQVWDYPLRYKEVFNYMTRGSLGTYRGSVLTWSSISYSHRSNTLLEDIMRSRRTRQSTASEGEGGVQKERGRVDERRVFER